MSDFLDEALGIREPKFNEGGEEELKPMTDMVVVPLTDLKTIKRPEAISDDVWDDYVHSRDVAKRTLEQAQIALASAVEFVNSSPSARSFEVLGNLMKIVNDCAANLLDLQKKLRDLDTSKDKDGDKDHGKGKAGDTYVIVGDPTDVLNKIDALREQKDVVDGKAERV